MSATILREFSASLLAYGRSDTTRSTSNDKVVASISSDNRKVDRGTHYSPACSASLAGIGAIFLILVETDRYVIILPRVRVRVVDLGVMIDKPLNELMGVMNRSLDEGTVL